MTDLILTIIHGYDYPFVEPFFKSLKAVGYQGDLVVFVSNQVSRATRNKIKENGAVIIDYSVEYPFFEKYENVFQNITASVTINNYRFLFYMQYLTAHAGKYNRVMLTDIRDVIFQQHPFKANDKSSISFFLEDPSQNFRHQFNYEWLADATDRATADKLADEVVSCAGITIGQVKPVIDYLNYIKSKLMHREKLEWGLDQGIHNSYIYLTAPAGMQVYNSDQPYVINLGAYQRYKLNEAGEVVNSEGRPYAIVHQYDRSGVLFARVKERYIGSRLTQKLKRMYYLLMP